MAKMIADRVLDFGLTDFHTLADKIYIVSQDPADFTGATSTYALGNKNHGAANCVGNPAPGLTPTGRKVTTTAITDGAVTGSGTANGWAVVDSVNSRLLVNGGIQTPQVVTIGNSFSLPAFDIKLANQ